jgi:hypothetical protein
MKIVMINERMSQLLYFLVLRKNLVDF